MVVEGRKGKKWEVKRDLYDWWLRKLWTDDNKEIVEGHRHYCLLVLVAYAVKCGIPYEEVEKDVY